MLSVDTKVAKEARHLGEIVRAYIPQGYPGINNTVISDYIPQYLFSDRIVCV